MLIALFYTLITPYNRENINLSVYEVSKINIVDIYIMQNNNNNNNTEGVKNEQNSLTANQWHRRPRGLARLAA